SFHKMLITCGKLFIIMLVINDIFEKVPIFDLFRVYKMLITCGKLFIIMLVINDIFEKVPIFDLFRVYNIIHTDVNTFLSR
ncbi:hypothetical protein DW979_12740, partial [Eubacterium sp. AM49-13BH]